MKKSISFLMSFVIASFSLSAFNSSIINAKAQEPTEIISLRSEYGKQFDNGDGTITSYINTVPIHYWDNGEWVEIDNSLILDENGNYTNKSSSFNITIPSEMTISNNLSDYDSDFQLEYEGYKISISLGQLVDINNSSECVEAKLIEKKTDEASRGSIPHSMKDSFEKVVSSVEYDSLWDGTDLYMDIRPDSLCEFFYFEKDSVIPDSLTFFVNADGLLAKQNENNEITFEDANGHSVLTIPVPMIKDSSCESMSLPVDVDITEYDNGYYISFYPNEPANEIEDPIYPLILSTAYSVQENANTKYISEASPYSTIYDQYMRIGNVENNGFQTFVSAGSLFNYSGNVTITDATFNMYLVGNYLSAPKALTVYSLNTHQMYVAWNGSSSESNDNTKITEFNVSYTEMYSWKEVDVTNLVQSWVNYGKTSNGSGLSSYNIGIPCYGFKIKGNSEPKATVVANSERASYNHPFFTITYVVNSDYTVHYDVQNKYYKYNQIKNYGIGSDIDNFKDKMNCYAYALQVYYRGLGEYKLMPGEFGISDSLLNSYNINTYLDLQSMYNYYQTTIVNIMKNICMQNISNPAIQNQSNYNNVISNTVFLGEFSNYSDFVEEQMMRDAHSMNFTIQKINTSSSFSLPSDFNENSERIIAMVTNLLAENYYTGKLDYHFYVRNGNGTCPIHGNNCSIWSQKNGLLKVENLTSDSQIICDATINDHTHDFSSVSGTRLYDRDDTRYFRITKEANVYASYHGNGVDDSSTGTPYYSY